MIMTHNSVSDKRLYIYNQMAKNDDDRLSNNLLFYVRRNDIPHSLNKNGCFLNLSTLEEEIVNDIYELVVGIETYEVIEQLVEYSSDGSVDEDSDGSLEIELSTRDIELLSYTKMI